MTVSWPDVVLAVLAGPLLVAGAAKVGVRGDRLSWPVHRGPLRAPVGPRLVGASEVLAAVAIVVVPGRAAAVIALTAGVALTAVSWVIRGRDCACFGVARLAAVGRPHVIANAFATATALAVLVGGPGVHPVSRAWVALTSAAVVSGVVLALDRRTRHGGTTTRCRERISAVRLYTSAGCPSCRAVRRLVDAMEPARRDAVDVVVLAEGENPPQDTGITGVPAAIGLGTTGEQVCAAALGVGAVKALVDSITVGAPDVQAGHAR